LAAITAVFTITYVAEMLGKDEELSIDMFPKDGLLRVCGGGEDDLTAVHRVWHRVLELIIADETAAGRAPRPIQSTE
jgi:hypothetical protein